MVNLVRRRLGQHAAERGRIVQVRVMEKQAAAINLGIVVKVIDPGAVEGAGPAHHAMHLIAFVQEKLSEIRTILACNPGDERVPHRQEVTRIRPSRWSFSSFRSASTISLTKSLNFVLGSQPSFFFALL